MQRLNPIEEAFLKASVEEQEEFCMLRHRILCRIIYNNVENSWCGRVLRILKEKTPETFEKLKGLKK